MKNHEQSWVKVNAPVDRDIADLIKALSLFPQLQTIESCQGHGERAIFVLFQYGLSWQDLSTFVLGYFGPRLMDLLGDRINIYINITEARNIVAELHIPPDSLHQTVRGVKSLARKFKG